MTNILSCIGNTPIVQLEKFNTNPNVQLSAKLEMFNPTLSIKDRIVDYMVTKAEKSGELRPGGVIVEATSGNTGASAAMIAAVKGYQAIITTPSKTSKEKVDMMRSYGATVHICPGNIGEDNPEHYITKAKALTKQTPNAYMLNQYNNLDNQEAHYTLTGPEIWEQTQGKIDYLIACGSSGGTVSGAGRYLKEQNPKIKIIMPDPVGSSYYDYFHHGKINPQNIAPYQAEGVGKDFICQCIDFSVVDDVVQFTDDDAFSCAKDIAKKEGLLLGGSSGAALFIAKKLITKMTEPANILVVCPDAGIKYLSSIFNTPTSDAQA